MTAENLHGLEPGGERLAIGAFIGVQEGDRAAVQHEWHRDRPSSGRQSCKHRCGVAVGAIDRHRFAGAQNFREKSRLPPIGADRTGVHRRNAFHRPLLQSCAIDDKKRRTGRLERGAAHRCRECFGQRRRVVNRAEGDQERGCVARRRFGNLPRVGESVSRRRALDGMALMRFFQLARRLLTDCLDFRLRALQFALRSLDCLVGTLQILLRPFTLLVGALELLLRSLSIRLGALQVLLRPLALGLRLLQVLLRPLTFALRPLQFFLGSLALALHTLQVLVRPFSFRVCELQLLLGTLALGLRTLQLVVCRLTIGLGTLAIRLCAFQVGLRALKIRLRSFPIGLGTLEIRLRPSALDRYRFLEFTTCLHGRLRRGLLGFASHMGDGLSQRALHIGTSSRHFGLESRAPLSMNRLELRGPPLVRVGLGPLACLLKSLLVSLGEATQILELGLKLGSNLVNHTAKLFLCH